MKSHASATWEGNLFEGAGTTTLASGASATLPVSWASRAEAAAGKTSPEELIAAAHASCFNMAFANGLSEGGNPPNRLDTAAVATFAKTDAGMRITAMELTVRGDVPNISAAEFAKAATAAKDGCPVSNALAGNVTITLMATLI